MVFDSEFEVLVDIHVLRRIAYEPAICIGLKPI